MISKKEMILAYMEEATRKGGDAFEGFTTTDLSEHFAMHRSNVSAILNELVKEETVIKTNTRPVMYRLSLVKGNNAAHSCFSKLIGYDRSLKNCVQLAKAAILYPEASMDTLLIGENGSGKSYFSSLMAEFAREQKIIGDNTPYIKFNCQYYQENEEDLLSHLFSEEVGKEGVFLQARNGVLFLDHVDTLTPKAKKLLSDYIENKKSEKLILICATEESSNLGLNEIFHSKFPVRIEIPSLKKRSMEERMELVEFFFKNEVKKMKKPIKINSELFRCFLLYYCQGNIKQLKNDIKIGCANAYVREINSGFSTLHVYLNDCHPYIRKGFLFYKENREKIEALIPENYTYTFTLDEARSEEEAFVQINSQTIYDVIEQKVKELRQRDIREEDIMTIVSTDIESVLMSVKNQIDISKMDRNIMSRIVDGRIISLVDAFLKEASVKFKKVYPTSTFYGLCLHLDACLKRSSFTQNLSNEKIMDIVDKYKQEYSFCTKFATAIEVEYDIRLPIDEVVFMTIFLCEDVEREKERNKPAVLVVMHGNVATSIITTVQKIYHNERLYSYDLLLDKDMKDAYEELKNLCKEIDNGNGLLIIYDMGSIRPMCESIVLELGIHAKMLEVPITLLLLDCAIKLSSTGTVDSVFEDILNNGFGSFGTLKQEYERQDIGNHQVIITLCHTGEGTARQIKQYLEKYVPLNGVDIVALAEGNTKILNRELNYRREHQQILCIVGTYDPRLYDIPFIPIAKLFDTPIEQLPMLLSLKGVDAPTIFDYEPMYHYLEEQLPTLNCKALKKCLPEALLKIKKIVPRFTINEEVGLFMHIACAINRLQMKEEVPTHIYRDSILSKNKRLYHELKEILEPVEAEMGVLFSDGELATIIDIIKMGNSQ